MDKTEQYIKMCDHPLIQNAIQDDWRNYQYCKKHKCLITHDQDGSTICPEMHRIVYDGNELDFDAQQKLLKEESCEYSDYWIVLPQQDDWQGMVKWSNARGLLCELEFWAKVNYQYAGIFNKSMEQLWAVFIMHELHKLKWTGDKWETIE